jgi:hypothetical protein
MTNAHKMPRPIRISRKLKLSSENVAVMVMDLAKPNPTRCTARLTGCPIHTC